MERVLPKFMVMLISGEEEDGTRKDGKGVFNGICILFLLAKKC